MDNGLRKSGIESVGDIPWGTHLCQFYRTKEDLLDVLIPYFKAGLENNELCVWFCWDPLPAAEAMDILSKSLQGINEYISKGRIEIADYSRQLIGADNAGFSCMKQFWVDKEKLALERGWDGLRIAGNSSWLDKERWDIFKQYEWETDDIISNHRMLFICPYSLEKCGPAEIIDVIGVHKAAFIRCEREWMVIENAARKKGKEVLLKSDNKYQVLVNSINSIILQYDMNGKITFFNKYALQFFGYSEDEVIGRDVMIIVPPKESGGRTLETLPADILESPEKYTENINENVKKSGERVWVSWRNTPVKDSAGRVIGNMAVGLDITKQKKYEDELSKSKSFLSNAMKIANLGHWEYDVEKDSFTFNDNFYAIFRTTAAQVGGYTMSSADYVSRFIYPEDSDIVKTETRKALETDDPHFNRQLEHRIIYADGGIGYIAVRFFIVKDDRGKTIKTYGVNQDITERKEAEEKLIQALKEELRIRAIMTSMLDDNNLIREELENKLRELKQTQVMLVQSAKMASVGQLAGGVAHEINNPLTGVINNIQLIKMEADAGKEFKLDDFKEILGVIEESALRCKKITESLLSFSRLSCGASIAVSLNDISMGVVSLISHELELENVHIHEEFSPVLPMILGDVQLFQQVLMNLIVNANWAIQKKNGNLGGDITIKTWYDETDKSVCLLISDTGIGIAPENINRIFEPFFTTKEVGRGTGLGLALSYNIIQSYKGGIKVESELGKGSVFTIKLPALGG